MGLDMYLTRRYYVAGEYAHRNVTGSVTLNVEGKEINLEGSQVHEITSRVGYWRKANAIHAWFVDNVQDGEDNCQESYVSYEQLTTLKELCKKVLETKDANLLKPRSGFFFGSTEVNDGYFADLEDTINMLDRLDPEGEYYYRSSW